MNITKVTAAPVDTQGHSRHRVLWGTQILLAALFVFAAIPKLAGVHYSVQMFNEIGAGQWLMYFVGGAELAGAIGLMIPRLAGFAAVGLMLDMVGASIINLVVLHSAAVAFTVPLAIATAFVARTRLAYLLGSR